MGFPNSGGPHNPPGPDDASKTNLRRAYMVLLEAFSSCKDEDRTDEAADTARARS